jgi:hypothetical protein
MAARITLDLEDASLGDLESYVQQALALNGDRSERLKITQTVRRAGTSVAISVPVTVRKTLLDG